MSTIAISQSSVQMYTISVKRYSPKTLHKYWSLWPADLMTTSWLPIQPSMSLLSYFLIRNDRNPLYTSLFFPFSSEVEAPLCYCIRCKQGWGALCDIFYHIRYIPFIYRISFATVSQLFPLLSISWDLVFLFWEIFISHTAKHEYSLHWSNGYVIDIYAFRLMVNSNFSKF